MLPGHFGQQPGQHRIGLGGKHRAMVVDDAVAGQQVDLRIGRVFKEGKCHGGQMLRVAPA